MELNLPLALRRIDESLSGGRWAEAESLARAALSLSPNSWELIHRRAGALVQLRRPQEAEALVLAMIDHGAPETLAAVTLLAELKAAQDDVHGAIALLEPLTDIPALQQRTLQRLLHLTRGRLAGPQPHAWLNRLIALEPGHEDPPTAGPVGEAEVTASPLDPAAINACLRRHGCVILRGAFDVAALAPAAARLQAVTEGGPGYRDFLSVIGGAAAAEALIPAGLRAGLTAFFQRPAQLALEQCWARRVDPRAGAYLHWHQDAARIYINGVVCWTPLDPCGVDAPGLEIAARRLRVLLDRDPITSAAEREVMDVAEIERHAPRDTWIAPAFAPGDCALFLTSQAHRSRALPEMTRSRRSLEFRFVAEDLAEG